MTPLLEASGLDEERLRLLHDLIAGILEGGETLFDRHVAKKEARSKDRNVAVVGFLLSPVKGIPLAGGFIEQAITVTLQFGVCRFSKEQRENIFFQQAPGDAVFDSLVAGGSGQFSVENHYCARHSTTELQVCSP